MRRRHRHRCRFYESKDKPYQGDLNTSLPGKQRGVRARGRGDGEGERGIRVGVGPGCARCAIMERGSGCQIMPNNLAVAVHR